MNDMFVNTHSHVYDEAFDEDRDIVLQRAFSSHVTKIILPDIDKQSRERMFSLSEQYPDHCYPLLGIHPTSVTETYETELEAFYQELSHRTIYGIGEVGMDLYWDKTYVQEQELVFSKQVAVALERNLPLVIHVRKAFNETYHVLRSFSVPSFSGIFHCFSGSKEEAYKIIDMGFHIGIGGVLTFKTSHLDEIVKSVPRDVLVLETDDPWLTPAPHRGKRNEPGYVTVVAERMASILQTSVEEVMDFTTANAVKVFNLV